MSHGNLSPRQKMINLMYLVLTALLAMNVSAEVLNAFVLVNESLRKTETSITAKNDDIYAQFASKYEANKNKVGEWKSKSDRVQSISKDLVGYITELQELILTGAGEDLELYKEKGTGHIEKKDERESPLFTMLEEKVDGTKRALILKAKIGNFRDSIAAIIGEGETAKSILESMNTNLNTNPIEGEEKVKEWEIANFDQLPLVAVISMLSKMKTDVLNVESDAITYLMSKIEAKSFKFTKVEAFVDAEKGYVLQGEQYNARIFIAASDTTQIPVIRMENGDLLPVDTATGMGSYSVKTGGAGIFKVKGQIELLAPGSTTDILKYPFEKEYQVAVPSVSVSPTAMNVFYIGVNNPVEITAAGTPADKLSVSISGGNSISRSGKGYNVKVSRVGTVTVTVAAEGRTLGSKKFRVKRVPDPVTTIGGDRKNWKGGNMPQSTLLALRGVNATLENFDFDLKFTITRFDVTCNIGGFDETERSNNYMFTTRQKNLIRQVKRKSRVIIENVKARGPAGDTRKLNDVVLKML